MFSEPSATPTKDIIKSVFLKNAFKVPTFEFMEQIRTPKKPSTNNINLYKNFTQGLGEMIKKVAIFRQENQLFICHLYILQVYKTIAFTMFAHIC